MAGSLVLGILLGIQGVHIILWLTVAVGGFVYGWHLMDKDGRGILLRTNGSHPRRRPGLGRWDP